MEIMRFVCFLYISCRGCIKDTMEEYVESSSRICHGICKKKKINKRFHWILMVNNRESLNWYCSKSYLSFALTKRAPCRLLRDGHKEEINDNTCKNTLALKVSVLLGYTGLEWMGSGEKNAYKSSCAGAAKQVELAQSPRGRPLSHISTSKSAISSF